MIPLPYRLKLYSKTEFVGHAFRLPEAVIVTRPASAPVWAVRVSKKVALHATVRNRLRRQINHFLYRERARLKPQQFLVILRQNPTADLEGFFTKINPILFIKS